MGWSMSKRSMGVTTDIVIFNIYKYCQSTSVAYRGIKRANAVKKS